MARDIYISAPDDWHLHLRDGAMLRTVLPESARHFARALVMPNLVPPVTTGEQAAAYRERILSARPHGSAFEPLMTLYLTEATDPDDVAAAAADGLATAVKLYPAGATTNSQSGVVDVAKIYPVLERMAEIGLPLCVHGEVTNPGTDIFDREKAFLEQVLDPLRREIPELRVVLEHVTTLDAVEYVRSQPSGLAATITAHHLVLDRNRLLAGGIRPHLYCLPIAKRAHHRRALVAAAVSGDPRFFLGTDSAPHADSDKESPCGCAGCFTAPNALPIAAEIFEREGALERLEGFVSRHGAEFYGLPVNPGKIALAKGDAVASPGKIPVDGGGHVTVFDPGFELRWRATMTGAA